jgi:dTDP-4-dehydrorhamnose 3,5-epimerase
MHEPRQGSVQVKQMLARRFARGEKMSLIEICKTAFPEVVIIKAHEQRDLRGSRYSNYIEADLLEHDVEFKIKQETIYKIEKPNTIYGIHYQCDPKPQQKLIGIIKGSGRDYVIDLRKKSASYKKWICIELNDKEHDQVLVPRGFGHLFRSIEANTILRFQVDEYFDDELNMAISYMDPEIQLDIIDMKCICSDKDREAPFLKNINWDK